jgi:hypothetical protein
VCRVVGGGGSGKGVGRLVRAWEEVLGGFRRGGAGRCACTAPEIVAARTCREPLLVGSDSLGGPLATKGERCGKSWA